ncbi:hypothetical protein CIB48_g790 [Xylaria polymorpha]|nr:hypothetical protein CIB48_g790 [Xylaria polymorpha]
MREVSIASQTSGPPLGAISLYPALRCLPTSTSDLIDVGITHSEYSRLTVLYVPKTLAYVYLPADARLANLTYRPQRKCRRQILHTYLGSESGCPDYVVQLYTALEVEVEVEIKSPTKVPKAPHDYLPRGRYHVAGYV